MGADLPIWFAIVKKEEEKERQIKGACMYCTSTTD